MKIDIDTPESLFDLLDDLEARGWQVCRAGEATLDVSLPTGDWDSPFLARVVLARVVRDWQERHPSTTVRLRPPADHVLPARRVRAPTPLLRPRDGDYGRLVAV